MAHLFVHVTPRASRDRIESFDGNTLRLRVTAAPADGAANAAVVKLLSKALGLPARDIVLTRGATSREKAFDVPLESSEIHALLLRALAE
ncbi:MAG: DUF167 family protein [Tepidiformaceae bacterium]